MPIILVLIGILVAVLANDWRLFALSVVIAMTMMWSMDAVLHDHIHELTNEEGRDNGETIE